MAGALGELAHDPFAALVEIERLCRSISGESSVAGEADGQWVGLGFRVGEQRFLAPRECVREVLLPVSMARVPGAKPWLKGVANVRGALLAVTDLRHLLEGVASVARHRQARIISLKHPHVPAGILVDEVFGFRYMSEAPISADSAEVAEPYRPYLSTVYRYSDEVWGVLDLYRLLESAEFQNASDLHELL